MATFTLRKLDDEVAAQFKQMAKDHGRSTEAELRSVVEEVTRHYLEEKRKSVEAGKKETGLDWFLRAKHILQEGLSKEDIAAEPFVIPERDRTARPSPFEDHIDKGDTDEARHS